MGVFAKSFATKSIATKSCVAIAAASALAVGAASAQGTAETPYTVNGVAPPIETQQMMMLGGLPPGAYYMHTNGDFGLVGQPPMMNANGGPPLGGGSPPNAPNAQPTQPQQPAPQSSQPAPSSGAEATGRSASSNASAAAPELNGEFPDIEREAARSRIFWVYSPSIFSGASGGSSGYVHLCPGGLALRTSEGSISIGGEVDDRYEGGRDGWAGAAGVSADIGRWAIESGANGPVLAVYNSKGGVQRAPVNTVRKGSWKFGQTKYAIERNKASCPG